MPTGNRIMDNKGAGFRGNPADFGSSASSGQRGGWDSEQDPAAAMGGGSMLSSQLPGNPHSTRGFRKALEKTSRTSGGLKNQMPDKVTFGGKGYKKPNYFAQGGKRHGMHISTGAPHTSGGQQEGADAGGN